MEYPIWYNGTQIGTTRMQKCGLYMEISGVCKCPDEGFYRVCVQYIGKTIDLGLLIKENDLYCLRKRIAIKVLGNGTPLFAITPNHAETLYYPLSDRQAEPFEYLDKIRSSRLSITNEVIYIVG